MINSTIGLIHTIFALLAMVLGGVVLLKTKGNRTHIRIGYAYVVCMLALNGTAFAIYNFGGFSIFHGFALISLGALLGGMIPVIRKTKNWYPKHFYFMNWSVVGLYCAFWAETGTRLLEGRHFWWVVALASFGTAMVGMVIINRKAKQLFKQQSAQIPQH
ncbi:MAG: DUF2306 domain-containing protein [Cytophagia bacterium]|nr:DUF2306 domain-containing protein [Cytophagia bacterium]